ncbi:unnamed protein product [Spirodela intermedia]|uniref:Uncharacterized protein n=1 Tax=Spirodela intermedia TaxID=51605 RepID=A0A7I8KTX8_SPIIN|nr:unnamed protein product [Spirodela intermedia]
MWWGNGGRFYWARREASAEGIVVVFAWLSSREKPVRSYVNLYGSLGWNSLVCHCDFLTLFFPEKGTSLALGVLHELAKEVKNRQLPIVFSAFSGGPKGCMYKLFQIIEGKCEGQLDLGEYDLVRDCACGQIYDSSPVDFTSDLGTRFVLHPSVLRMSEPPRIVSWMAKMLASGLDTLFLRRFEEQRADYWQTLFSSTKMGPVLVLCSEDDELAPFSVIHNFVECLKEQGSDVKLIKWASSPHVGHYKHYPVDYQAAVSQLLSKAVICYSQRMQQLSDYQASGLGNSDDHASGSGDRPRKALAGTTEGLKGSTSCHSVDYRSPCSVELEAEDVGPGQDEKRGDWFHLEGPEAIAKILSDMYSPKTIESWDIMHNEPLRRRQRLPSPNKRGSLNDFRGMRRSKL